MPANKKYKDTIFTSLFSDKYCIDKGILRDYLKQNSSEVVNMLYTEFKLEDAIAVREKEAEARGVAKARNELFSLWEKGVPLAEAKRKLKLARS